MSDFDADIQAGSSETSNEPMSNDALVALAGNLMRGEEPSLAKTASDGIAPEEIPDADAQETAERVEAKPQEAEPEFDPRERIRARMEKARAAKMAKAQARREAEMAEKLRQYESMMAPREPEKGSFDIDGFKRKLAQSPLTALQELGINLDEFTQAAIEENTPQSRMLSQMKAMEERINAFERQRQEFEQKQREQHEERVRYEQDQAFCSIITPDDYPSLHEFFKEDPYALIREADALAKQLIQRGSNPDDIDDSDLADYLEEKYAKTLMRIKGRAEAQRTAQPLPSKSRGRAPTQSSASDTTIGSQKNFWDLSAGEQDALLKEIARNEMSKTAN
jgi:hypothetical protein